jgi:hypothetical protein
LMAIAPLLSPEEGARSSEACKSDQIKSESR